MHPTSEQLHAFHDDRLAADVRGETQRHIAACPVCAQELARLSSLSQLLSGIELPRLSQISRHRLHAGLDAAMERNAERSLIRIGWSLSGLAASILVIGSALLMRTTPVASEANSGSTTPPWMAVENAINNNTDSTVTPTTPVAQWYLADASSSASSSD